MMSFVENCEFWENADFLGKMVIVWENADFFWENGDFWENCEFGNVGKIMWVFLENMVNYGETSGMGL